MQNRFETLAAAEIAAARKTDETGETHVAYESDYAVDRFVVARMPHVGDEVSKAFNGDAYSCGRIARVSKTYSRITTTSGETFTRVGPVRWRQGGKNGAFSLIQGFREERNPHF